jgi:hypothetical protein
MNRVALAPRTQLCDRPARSRSHWAIPLLLRSRSQRSLRAHSALETVRDLASRCSTVRATTTHRAFCAVVRSIALLPFPRRSAHRIHPHLNQPISTPFAACCLAGATCTPDKPRLPRHNHARLPTHAPWLAFIHTLIVLCAPRPQPLRSSPYRPLLPVSRERVDLRMFAAERSAIDSCPL